MSTEHSNHYKYQLHNGNIDWSNDSFKIILMDTGFTFDKDADATYADVSSDELSTGNGYTQNTKTLSNISISEDDTNDRSVVTCDDISWTANGGTIGPTPGVAIFDDSTTDDTVVAYLDFGGEITIADGNDLDVADITIILA